MPDPTKRLLRVLAGEALSPPPWWLMRQAGRYLPEYREIRRQAGDFVQLCLTPALAAELTLQPVRRFGMDAAILFSDILLIPWALGQRLAYREGEGPVLDPIADAAGLASLDAQGAIARLEPILDAARRVGAALDRRTALIGFAGAPWTVATYMVEGGGSRDFQRVKGWAYRDPQGFGALLALLTETTIELLVAEIAAGADVVQLFDSWAGVLPEPAFVEWVVEPTRRIVAAVKARHPGCRVIGFPRGAGMLYEDYVARTGIDAVSLDTAVPLAEARSRLAGRVAIQGNLDPVLLLAGGTALDAALGELRRSLDGCAWIFNLGHGVLPDTPPAHVAALARALRRTPVSG